MFSKYFILTFMYKMCLAEESLLYAIKYGIKYLNDELNSFGNPVETETQWIEQPLDHFDKNETRTWNMRYFERLTYQKVNGPVYLYLGGETAASSRWTSTGIMYELAKETRGAMYVTEHRYYGQSKPLNGTGARTFRFLNSRQALADIAKLVKYIKSLPKSIKSKVVLIGGSYAGNLAAWMKLLYPNLVDAALASSGPVLAKVDFYEYLEKVSDNYEHYGTDGCLEQIRAIFQRYDRLFESPEGIEQLKSEENICKHCDLSKEENKQVFFTFKVGEFMGNSQYGTRETFKNHCINITSNAQKGLMGKQCTCYDFENTINEYYAEENEWALAWFYQTCTEFGYFQTTSSNSQPFTNNIPPDFYIKMCSKIFGSEFNEKTINDGVNAANNFYGGKQLKVTNVVFSNGDLDPWSHLSILKDLSYNSPAVVIPGASHCRDLLSNRPGDSKDLIKAREYIKYLIKKSIGTTSSRLRTFKKLNLNQIIKTIIL